MRQKINKKLWFSGSDLCDGLISSLFYNLHPWAVEFPKHFISLYEHPFYIDKYWILFPTVPSRQYYHKCASRLQNGQKDQEGSHSKMLTAVIGTIITLTMLAHHRNKKSNKTRKFQLNFYLELIFALHHHSTKNTQCVCFFQAKLFETALKTLLLLDTT